MVITINYKETKKNVQQLVRQYDKSKTKIASMRFSKKGGSLVRLDLAGGTASNNSSTERTAINNLNEENPDLIFINKFESVLNSMNDEYRNIFVKSYLNDITNDYLADSLCVGMTTLIRKKREAIELFAYGMDILVED